MLISVKPDAVSGHLVRIVAILCFLHAQVFAQPAASSGSPWPAPSPQMKPWLRWWWLGNDVDTANLGWSIDAMRDAGIGGAEITPIYGVKGREQHYIPFLSQSWVGMLQFSIERAKANRMGIDMNVGTGWPFGGPQISAELGAGKLRLFRFRVNGPVRSPVQIPTDSIGGKGFSRIAGVTAYGTAGTVISLTAQTDSSGRISWSPGKGSWEVVVALETRTGQKVKRSAPGGEGLVLDHFRKDALQTYLRRFDTALSSAAAGVRNFFNDSYEVYGADFTPGLFDTFQCRRGYDLRAHLRQLLDRPDSDTMRRLRADYRQTVHELVLENFTRGLQSWAQAKGARFRNQAHGAPGNLLDLYGAVDVPETEMFGIIPVQTPGMHYHTSPDSFNHPAPDPVMLRFASSAANVLGKPLVSSETFTWLGEHFRIPLSNCKPEAEQAFLAGINHLFYHGAPYSPQMAAWPGWLFYASTHFGPSNTWWPHLRGLNDYVTRTQSILQTSEPDNEVLVYWPYDDVRQLAGKRSLLQMLQMNNIRDWLTNSDFYKTVTALDELGVQSDFISDAQLLRAKVEGGNMTIDGKARPYRVIVVPELKYMSVATFRAIYNLATGGATVIFQNLPNDVAGLANLEINQKALRDFTASIGFATRDGRRFAEVGNGRIFAGTALRDVLPGTGVMMESARQLNLQMLRKTRDGDKLYYLVNHSAKDFAGWIPTHIKSEAVRMLDPQSGAWGSVSTMTKADRRLVYLELPAGQAAFLEAGSAADKAWAYRKRAGNPVALNGPWAVHFHEGGPQLPRDTVLKALADWTQLGGAHRRFSGRATYATSFRVSPKAGSEYELNLGEVFESARVFVNGKDAGIVWSVPTRLQIGSLLKRGTNELRIEVANLMANRIIEMDRRNEEWRIFNEINFVNFNYKKFDASGWDPLPSGLLGPVTITELAPGAAPVR